MTATETAALQNNIVFRRFKERVIPASSTQNSVSETSLIDGRTVEFAAATTLGR